MNPIKGENENAGPKTKQPIPPPPPIERFWLRKTITESITKKEIARYWKQKRIDEEDHLLAAIKAAARIRARNLSVNYKQFVESLEDEDSDFSEKNVSGTKNSKQDENNNEVRVGIKDWWTKSKYAYLNQPAMDSMDTPKKRTSTHVPNCFTYKPVPVYPSSLGVC